MPFCRMGRCVNLRPLPTIHGAWLILAAAALWGTTGTAQALAPEAAQPAATGTLRLVIGSLALLALALLRGRLQNPLRWSMPALAAGVGGVAAYQLCFFAVVDRTGVAVGTIVGIGSAPILAGLLDVMVNGVRLSRRWMTATGLAVAGCSLLAASGEAVGVDTGGIVLALGAGLSYAVYTLASKRLLRDHPPEAVMAALFCLGAVLLSPALLVHSIQWVGEWCGLLVILHLGIITVALSYVLFARGLMTVPASTAVTLTLAEPLTAGLLGVLVLRERLTLAAFAGVFLLFLGLYWLTRRE